jgi:hypothetical protein
MMSDALVLRDVHEGVAPAWWPPAPGWWLLLVVVLLALAAWAWRRRRARIRRQRILRLFDDAVARPATPAEQVAAMSELLRRAARRVDPAADRLQDEAWTAFLDAGLAQPVFTAGAGAILREGAFRHDVTAAQADALRSLARERYLAWMLQR